MLKFGMTIMLIALLSGCATDPAAQRDQAVALMNQKIRIYGPACEKLGYEANTDPWRECIQHEYDQVIARQQRQLDYMYLHPYRGFPYYYYRW